MSTLRKIWVGIGVAVVTPGVGPSLNAAILPVGAPKVQQPPLHRIGKDHPPGQAGAVGGETYLRDGSISDTRTRFSRDMILLQGHALIADEAVADAAWSTALAHLTASTEDIRSKLEPYMKGQGVAPFSAVIARLTKAIDAKDQGAYAAARRAFDDHANRAALAIKKFQEPYIHFQLRAVVEALKAASSAYDAAISEQNVTDISEYRDSRGFVLAAERALVAVSAELTKINEPRARAIKTLVVELKAAWPSFAPPTVIVMNAEDVALLVARIEVEAMPYWQ